MEKSWKCIFLQMQEPWETKNIFFLLKKLNWCTVSWSLKDWTSDGLQRVCMMQNTHLYAHDFATSLGFLFVWCGIENNNKESIYFMERFNIATECACWYSFHSVVDKNFSGNFRHYNRFCRKKCDCKTIMINVLTVQCRCCLLLSHLHPSGTHNNLVGHIGYVWPKMITIIWQ